MKTYLRYSLKDAFGVIASPECEDVISINGRSLRSPEVSSYTKKDHGTGNVLLSAVGQRELCAISGACHTAILWDVSTGEKLKVFGEDEATMDLGHVTALAMDSAMQSLSVGYSQGALRVWRFGSSGEERSITFDGHRSAISTLCFNLDGSRLASGSADTDIVLWDMRDERGLFRLRGHRNRVTCVRFTKLCGIEHLISCSKDSLVKVWDLDAQCCVDTIVGHKGDVWSLDVRADKEGTSILTGSRDGIIRAWKVPFVASSPNFNETQGSSSKSMLVPGSWKSYGSIARQSNERVANLRFSACGHWMGCQASGRILEVYRVRDSELALKRLKRRQKRAREKRKDTEIPERDVSDDLGLVGIVRTKAKMTGFSFCVDSDCREGVKLLVASANNKLEVFEFQGDSSSPGASVPNRKNTLVLPGHRSEMRSLALSGDGKTIMTCSTEEAKLWEVDSGACFRSIRIPGAAGCPLCCAFVPGDLHGLVGTRNGQLMILDLMAAHVTWSESAHHGSALWSMSIRPDESGIMTGGSDKVVKFWDFELVPPQTGNGGEVLILTHTRTLKLAEDVLCVTFSRKFSKLRVAVALLDCTVKVFFDDTLKFAYSLYGHRLPVLDMDVSSDDALLVTASADKNIKIWGTDYGDCHRSIFAHDASVMKVQFVPKTHYIFSAGKDGRLRYWDGDRFQMIYSMNAHRGEVWCMAISNDGSRVVTGGHDKAIRQWNRTDEPVFIEEEREKELEKLFDEDFDRATPDVVADQEESETGVVRLESVSAGMRSGKTVRAGERLMEAIDMSEAYKEKIEAWRTAEALAYNALSEEEKRNRSSQSDPRPLVAMPSAHVKMLGRTPNVHVAKTLSDVKSQDLEEALLLLPFTYVSTLCVYLNSMFKARYHADLAARCTIYLAKVHFKEMKASTKMRPVLRELRENMEESLLELRDMVGVNIAALQHMRRQQENNKIFQ